MSVFEPGDEENMVRVLSDTWARFTTDNLYTNWNPYGILTGLGFESGVLDTSPLTNFVHEFLSGYDFTFKRRFSMSTVDANTGTYIINNETCSDPVKAVMSSASIPFVFPSQKWDNGNIDMDGGSAWRLNLVSAVHRCREIVDDDSKITLDIVSATNGKQPPDLKNQTMALGNYL